MAELEDYRRKTSPREDVLEQAHNLIMGDRNVQYGPPNDDFNKTAIMWDTYIKAVFRARDSLKPHDVAAMMAMLKLSRIAWAPQKQDNWIDLAGYAACGWDCVEAESESIKE